MTATFTPRGQEGLLLRNPLMQNYLPPSYHNKSLLYSRNIRPYLTHKEEAHILEEGSMRPQKIGFYTRHNPHPGRVRHMKGLLDAPICIVEDNYERRLLYSAPTNEDYSIHYRPSGSTRYSANGNKQTPAIGIVPITYAWKEELEKKTNKALKSALQDSSVPSSHQSQRQAGQYDQLQDEQILDLLCRILQTNSIPACHAWLQSCSESEKIIVLNMLRMAATGEIDPYPRLSTCQSEPLSPTSIKQPMDSSPSPQYINDTSIADEASPFKLPEHDTIIRAAHSRLLSRQSERSFHERLQTELDHRVSPTASRLRTPATSKRHHSKSLSCNLRPVSNRSSRPRSNSTGIQLNPPPPVYVNITQEQLKDKGKQNRYHY